MEKTSFISTVGDGGKVSCAMALRKLLEQAKGSRVKITIEPAKRVRSGNQNAYYWGVVIPAIHQMFVENGNNVDGEDVHEYLKAIIGKLAKNIVLPTGEVQKISGSTAVLSTMQFEEYLDKCRVFAAEFGVIIPMPNEEVTNA